MANFEIGTTLAGMTNIEALTVPLPVPLAPPPRFARRVRAASGRVYGQGFVSCEWVFSPLSAAQRAQLKTLCAGESANVFIKTLAADDTYRVYQAVMVWPESEDREPAVRDRIDFAVSFTHLVEIV
jgi:hypothetical protein